MAPRTLLGLEAMLSRHLELLEHGLSTVAQTIELSDVASIAVLARDAGGAPVLIFADDRSAQVPAALRATRAHAHLLANPWLMQRLFPHRPPAALASCLRVIVVAFRFDELALATLRALALPDLLALELHEWSVAGQRQWCARPAWQHPGRNDAGFSPPSATPTALLPIVSELMCWLERLDADMTVECDRFARRVSARGRPLCTLALDGRAAELTLPEGFRRVLASRDDAIAAMDAVMQHFQHLLQGDAPVTEAASSAPPTMVEGFDLTDLRRAVAGVHLTRAECSALQLGDSDS